MKLSLLTAIIGFTFFLASCGELAPPTNIQEPVLSNPSPVKPAALGDNLLQAGDDLKITFPDAEELNISQKVRPDGKLSLPIIGEVTASGQTVTRLQSELKFRYKKHLQDPNVIVTIESTASTVYVSGKVVTPLKIVLERKMTALEAIMEAGGFNEFGSSKKVVVIRNENGQHKRHKLNLNEALYSGDSNAFYLKPFDVIYAY